jgi:DNA repair photolyase
MIKEIQAKSILVTSKNPSGWFGAKYNMNIYRGCQHGCIYCDSRSECYQIENFDDIIVKANAIELLKSELPRKRIKGTIATGAMSDPYIPLEKQYNLTGQALRVIADHRYPVQITTKSNLVLRDVEMLQEINKTYACVAFTITTCDDSLAKKVEPFAPSSTQRLEAMGILSSLGICTGITMMPILPFIEDSVENITEIVKKAKEYGAQFIFPAFGMTLRDRQREYYYRKLDELFPGTREKYEKRFKNYYSCSVSSYAKVKNAFYETCNKYGVSTKIPTYESKKTVAQLSLFNP